MSSPLLNEQRRYFENWFRSFVADIACVVGLVSLRQHIVVSRNYSSHFLFRLEKGNLQEFSPKVKEVGPKVELLRKNLKQLNGINCTEVDQLNRIAQLYEQLQLKVQLIEKYRTSGTTILDVERTTEKQVSSHKTR